MKISIKIAGLVARMCRWNFQDTNIESCSSGAVKRPKLTVFHTQTVRFMTEARNTPVKFHSISSPIYYAGRINVSHIVIYLPH